jgi:uncharacterized membrane protein YfcA
MVSESKKENLKQYLVLPAISLLAGGINGFLGTGAGIVLVYLLNYLNRDRDETKNNFAMTIVLVLPMSAISLFFYVRGGNVDSELIRLSIIPAVLGGILGGYLMDKINRKLLGLIFAVLVIYSGFQMVI